MRPLIIVAAVVASIALAGTALAGGHSTSSVSLVVTSAATSSSNASGSVPFGSTVTYNVVTSATSFPWVETICTQGKTIVYAQTQGFSGSALPNYQLGPTPLWSGGAASCTATLFSYDLAKRKDLASTTFTVG